VVIAPIWKKSSTFSRDRVVCFELDAANRERELNGLREAMKELGIRQGMILTYNQEEKIPAGEGPDIVVVPVWRWLVEDPVPGRG
jgi:hypothetical protein